MGCLPKKKLIWLPLFEIVSIPIHGDPSPSPEALSTIQWNENICQSSWSGAIVGQREDHQWAVRKRQMNEAAKSGALWAWPKCLEMPWCGIINTDIGHHHHAARHELGNAACPWCCKQQPAFLPQRAHTSCEIYRHPQIDAWHACVVHAHYIIHASMCTHVMQTCKVVLIFIPEHLFGFLKKVRYIIFSSKK